jgi:cell division protein FtsB
MELIERSLKFAGVLVLIALLIFLVIGFNNRMSEQRQLSAQADKIRAELQELRQTEASLDAQIAYANSDAAVEEWAYEEAHWARQGDQPVVLIPGSEAQPEANSKTMVATAPVANWQVWWALFFDETLPANP